MRPQDRASEAVAQPFYSWLVFPPVPIGRRGATVNNQMTEFVRDAQGLACLRVQTTYLDNQSPKLTN